jgi:hypothetical protein
VQMTVTTSPGPWGLGMVSRRYSESHHGPGDRRYRCRHRDGRTSGARRVSLRWLDPEWRPAVTGTGHAGLSATRSADEAAEHGIKMKAMGAAEEAEVRPDFAVCCAGATMF